jgi:hypothetical protein
MLFFVTFIWLPGRHHWFRAFQGHAASALV